MTEVFEVRRMTDKEAERQELMELNRSRLEELAYRAIHYKYMKPKDFFVICIHVDDLAWTDLVEELMPGQDWQAYRDRGEIPVVRGSVWRKSVGGYLGQVCPAIRPVLGNPDVSEQIVQAVVLAAGGASVYEVEPRVEPS